MIRRSLDTEVTGIDIRHGARPFLVTMADVDRLDAPFCWEWDVNPFTRQPDVPLADLEEIQAHIEEADELILQNPKFDYLALVELFRDAGLELRWDWSKVRDTLLAGHVLNSLQPHDLTTMAMVYLSQNILPLETRLESVTKEARTLVRSKAWQEKHGRWNYAEEGLDHMPSAKPKKGKDESVKMWKLDMWLPRAVAKAEGHEPGHHYWTACSDYANGDSVITAPLFVRQEQLLKQKKLWNIYLKRLEIVPIIAKMEATGITVSRKNLDAKQEEYEREAQKCADAIIGNSAGLLDKVPGGRSNALNAVIFDHYKLTSTKKTEAGNDSMDKRELENWINTLEEGSPAHTFVKSLADFRSRTTAIQYMNSYRRFWLPAEPLRKTDGGWKRFWYRLHPSLNPTGTDTLRFSSSNPNEQNISKKKGFNLRYAFGPAPGREWWSCDAKNIELRLPAYEAGETEMVDLFERPDVPPFFGSNHILVFSILHPEMWADALKKHGPNGAGQFVKDEYESSWYQWTKNGNFAVQYGAVEESGTADRAYHVPGAQRRIAARFTKIDELNQRCITFAKQRGYVETMPDRTVDPDRGYPLYCSRTSYGGILETVPLNYHIQGSAMWWMMQAMIRVQDYLDRLNADDPRGYYMIMQVHDELVFDFPKGRTPEPWREHRPKVRKIQHLMAQGGADLIPAVPTPVSCEYHPDNWSGGIAL